MAKRFTQRHAPRRARRLLIMLAAACLCAPCVPATLAARQKAPLVFMMTTRRDLGDIYKGEELELVFPVRNDGDATLEMDNKSLTGQVAPAARPYTADGLRAVVARHLMPVALRRAAPS